MKILSIHFTVKLEDDEPEAVIETLLSRLPVDMTHPNISCIPSVEDPDVREIWIETEGKQ